MSVTEAAPHRLAKAKAARRRDPGCSPTPPRKISQADFVAWASEHGKWLQRPSRERGAPPLLGAPVDLSECDFQADLPREGSPRISLRQADLHGCVFGKADLQDVDLRDADLTCAALADAQNLLAPQFSGADLCCAALPDGIKSFEGLAKVDDLSKTASGLFLSMLLSCVYVWLVNGATFDSQLLTNSTTSKLPIIQTDISIVTFYWDAPGVLLGIYLYFHIYMQRLWEAIAKLPAVFPGGETVDVKTYPWLLNDLVCRYFVQLQGRQPSLALLQTLLSVSLAWFTVPVTLLVIWGRYLRRHEGVGTALQLLLLIVAVWAGHEFYGLAKATLKREGPLSLRTARAGREEVKWRFIRLPCYCLALGGTLGLLSYGAMWGNQHTSAGHYADLPSNEPQVRWVREHAGKLTDEANLVGTHLGFKTSLDLGDGELSTKPANWDNTDRAAHAVQVLYWRNRNLRCVFARRAFMAGIFFDDTHMEGADLQGADLRHTHFKDTYLQGADLRGAFLGHALMQNAHLRGARLAGADMTDVVLDDMAPDSLQDATFSRKTTPQSLWAVLERYGASRTAD